MNVETGYQNLQVNIYTDQSLGFLISMDGKPGSKYCFAPSNNFFAKNIDDCLHRTNI